MRPVIATIALLALAGCSANDDEDTTTAMSDDPTTTTEATTTEATTTTRPPGGPLPTAAPGGPVSPESGSDDGTRTAEVVEATQQGTTLTLAVAACNAENTFVVEEDQEEVTVTVRTDGPRYGDACADGVKVELREPLGERRLIDGATGEVVEEVFVSNS
ncbi:MAG: hypothetical protein M3445_11210 [Actinomycetota bacterium]|nr:hypothetical protein [Actinomycetota bacterium]